MRLWVLLAGLAVALASPSAFGATPPRLSVATPDDVVRGFMEALPHVSYGELWPYTTDDVNAVWDGIDDLLERYSCVTIERWTARKIRVTDDRVVAKIHVDGTRSKPNGDSDPMPDIVLTLDHVDSGWRIVDCRTAADAAGQEFLTAQTDEERECMLARAHADRAAVLRAAAEASDNQLGDRTVAFCTDWARAHGDLVTEAACYRMDAYHRSGDAGAVSYGDLAVDLARKSGDADMLSRTLFTRGLAYWRAGFADRGIVDLNAAAALVPKLRDAHAALKALYMAAYIEIEQGDYRHALIDDERLRRLAADDGWQHGVALAMWQIGDIQDALRNFEIGRDYHEKVYASLRRAGDLYDSDRAIADVAFDEMNLGHFDSAEKLFSEVWWAASDKYIVAEMIASFSASRRYDALASLLGRVTNDLALDDPGVASQITTARATLAFHRKDYAAAERESREALAQSVSAGSTVRWPPWPAQLLLGRSLQAEQRMDEAEAAYRDAITTIEHESDIVPGDALGRVRYFGDKIEPYRALAALRARRGDGPEALAVAESVRSRALRELLEEGKIDIRRDLSADERAREDALEEQVSTLGRKALTAAPADAAAVRHDVDLARVALADYQAQLSVRHAALRNTVRPRREDVAAVLPRLGSHELAVEYMVGPRRTLVFLISRDGVQVRFLPATQQQLEQLAQRFAKALEHRDMRYVPVSRAIYDAVIAPLRQDLAGYHDICFIPDGALWLVPFEALRDRHGVDLIERATISYAPSLLILGATRSPRTEPHLHQLLAFGNPAISHSAAARVRSIERDATLGTLPEAADEVTRIGSIYGGRSAVFVGPAARESTLKANAPHFRIIHIAAHGFVEDRSPLYSCIVLAPDAADDGLLEMREVVDMKLNADLVVLSSCDSARGKIAPGEGVVGLSWAFLAAGCPSTVVSQWKVDSAATEQLMVDFHRRLAERSLAGKASALREAKLALRRDPRYRHPYYWAPFIVVGNGM